MLFRSTEDGTDCGVTEDGTDCGVTEDGTDCGVTLEAVSASGCRCSPSSRNIRSSHGIDVLSNL